MNLRLLKMTLLLCLAAIVSDLSGQGLEHLMVIKNEPASFTFLSRFAPVVGRNPEHGTAVITPDAEVDFSYTITYTPDTDYLGADDLLMVSFPFGINVAFTQFDIRVEEAEIKARHDFAATTAGQPVAVPVMVNDSVNVGNMQLIAAPVVNAGTVEIVADQVVFTPNPGFVGLTDFNYVICSDFENVCDLGTVSVNVLPGEDGVVTDTVRVFTKKDRPQFIFAPEGATPGGEPVSGSMVNINGVMAYQPDENFVGDEFLSYTAPGTTEPTVYHVTVLDLETNDFAFEDRSYTAIDHQTTVNVLDNDLYNVFADCITFSAPQFGSITETNRKGQVIYTPPTGWSGVDKFTYSSMAPGCDGEPEIQTVYVFVSNFAPAQSETLLTTPAGTPIDLTYDAPGGAVTWSVVDQPTNGTIITDPVSGQLSYLPNPTAAGQADALTLSYCLNADEAGNCAFSTEVTVTINVTATDPNACIDDDCVWPGDTNNDGVVDVDDLLPIGLAMGGTGTPRPTTSPGNWSAQYAENWGQDLNGLDFKHIDANGDQIINSLDTQVVMQNLGLTHRLRPEPQTFSTFELSLHGTLDAEPGDHIILDIVAGNNVVIVEDVFGFRFSFDYDVNIVDAQSIGLLYDEESWLSYDSPILSLVKNNPSVGRINTALTRTSRDAASGFGIIGQLNVVIVEDVFGFREGYELGEPTQEGDIITTIAGGEAATTINAAGHVNAVQVAPYDLRIKRTPPTEVADFAPIAAADYLDEKLIAYPNPTADRLVVHLNGQQRFSALQLTDLTGRVLRSEQGLDTNHRELALGDLPNGLYTLTLTTEDGVVNRKVQVAK